MPRKTSKSKSSVSTENLILSAKSDLEKLNSEKAAIDIKIKETKAKIAELETRFEIEKLSDINTLAKENNVTLNQLLSYLRSGGIKSAAQADDTDEPTAEAEVEDTTATNNTEKRSAPVSHKNDASDDFDDSLITSSAPPTYSDNTEEAS